MRRLVRLFALFLVFAAAPALAQVEGPVRRVAVTFDDLPYQASDERLCDPETALALTRDFLAMLAPLGFPAAGFVNEGKVCEAQRSILLPQVLDLWLDGGHDLGNHGFLHVSAHAVTAEAWLADVDRGAVFTRAALAARGRPLLWFRHPYLHAGETPEKRAALDAGLAGRGYRIAAVTLGNSDWMFAALYGRAEAEGDREAMRRIGEAYVDYMAVTLDHWEPYSAELTGGREPAQVLLLHANTLNRDWYPRIHALYLARGYAFVSLGEAMADPLYALPDDYARANGVSWLHRWTETQGRPIRWEPEPPEWIVAAYRAL